MAWTTVNWKSAVLGQATSAEVLLPEVGQPPFATFYLLHGLSDDATMWMRRTRIEWYVRDLPLIVVMPEGYRSFYTDHNQGAAYAQHYGRELPEFIERQFRARPERSGRAMGGLSMGGYGALRIGLGFAERFASVNSHSGAVGWGRIESDRDFEAEAARRNWSPAFAAELKRIFGPHPLGTEHDLLHLAKRAQGAGRLPRLLIDCGRDDFLIEDNRQFHAALDEAGVPHTYREFPGVHDWDYWDEHVRDALAFHAVNLGLRQE